MDILYRIRERQRRDGAGKCYEITTENGSIYDPISTLEILQATLTEKFGAVDSECERVVRELKTSGMSEIHMPDGSGRRI